MFGSGTLELDNGSNVRLDRGKMRPRVKIREDDHRHSSSILMDQLEIVESHGII